MLSSHTALGGQVVRSVVFVTQITAMDLQTSQKMPSKQATCHTAQWEHEGFDEQDKSC